MTCMAFAWHLGTSGLSRVEALLPSKMAPCLLGWQTGLAGLITWGAWLTRSW